MHYTANMHGYCCSKCFPISGFNKVSEHLIQLDVFNHLSANPTKRSNTLKQFVGNFPRNCLSVFDNFVGLALKGLMQSSLLFS